MKWCMNICDKTVMLAWSIYCIQRLTRAKHVQTQNSVGICWTKQSCWHGLLSVLQGPNMCIHKIFRNIWDKTVMLAWSIQHLKGQICADTKWCRNIWDKTVMLAWSIQHLKGQIYADTKYFRNILTKNGNNVCPYSCQIQCQICTDTICFKTFRSNIKWKMLIQQNDLSLIL